METKLSTDYPLLYLVVSLTQTQKAKTIHRSTWGVCNEITHQGFTRGRRCTYQTLHPCNHWLPALVGSCIHVHEVLHSYSTQLTLSCCHHGYMSVCVRMHVNCIMGITLHLQLLKHLAIQFIYSWPLSDVCVQLARMELMTREKLVGE